MKLHTKLLGATAIAALAFHGAAMAQDQGVVSLSKSYSEAVTTDVDNDITVSLIKESDVSKDMSLSGLVSITGSIEVSESAMATVDNKQVLNDNEVDGGDLLQNQVSVGEGVLAGASGKIGLNVAAGDNNAQDNASALAAVGNASAGASSDAQIFVYQEAYHNNSLSASNQLNNSEVLGDVLSGATGDIGLNVVTGAFNLQKNALTVASVTGEAVLAEAVAGVVQQTAYNTTSHLETQNTASLAGNVLATASGNIGANVGSGTNNVQANSLSIASVN